MPAYDPEQDIPDGIAGAAFPITFYDRPQYMFANLLRGDVDAATRAMLSPNTLTPSQIKTVRDVLMPPKSKPNLLMKTITDIATNPLVIMGLVLGLKYPVGSTKPLLTLRRGLMPKSVTMGKMMSGLHDAMMNLRTIPYLFESMLGVTRETTKFISKYGDDANVIFSKAGKMTKAEGALVAARLDGLHKPSHYLVKALRSEPEWIEFMGGKDVAIAPNIQNTMGGRLVGLSDRLRGWYNKVRDAITSDPNVKRRIQKAVEKKGLQFGEDVVDYFPHQGHYNKYYQQSIRGTTGTQYRKWLHREVGEKIGREEIARIGGMIPTYDSIRLLEDAGAVRPGFTDMVQRIMARKAAAASNAISGIWDDVAKLGLNEAGERAEFVRRVRDYYSKGAGKGFDYIKRLGAPKQATDTLDAMAGALQNARFKGGNATITEIAEIGRVLAEPAQYALNPWEATGKYLSSVASSYAWHGTGLGNKIMSITKQPGVFANTPHLETYVMDNLIPHIQGLKSYQELQRSLSFAVRKQKIHDWIKASPFVESALGQKTKKWLLDYFGSGSSLTSEGIAAKISHSFYLSTLGANISPASKNLLQNWLTTINTVGVQGMWRGLMGVAGHDGALVKMERYLKYLGQGMKSNVAFKKAFPEYVADMGDASQIVESLMAGDVAREGYTKMMRVGGMWEKVKKGLMFPFSTSEAFNRITGYYAGRNTHIHQNLRSLSQGTAAVRNKILKEAGEVGSTLTMASHFTGGPLGVPKAIMNLPSYARQFAHFPTRYLAYLHGSLRMGTDPNKLDWGTIGRTLAGSTGAYLAARNLLGVDLSAGLATGALPVPAYEQSPFYPFPIVPPIAGVAGGFAKALLTGSAEGLGSTAAMLVPGGLAARRMYRNLSPRFADYENRTPDGRVPLYNEDHALVGSLSPMQMVLRAAGITSTGVAGEQGAAKWLVSQRDRIRAYRRDWLQAMYENDFRRADAINKRFQKDYPELGPMEMKKSDIKALENRREISRLHRILRGMPSAYKPLFGQIINEAAIGRVAQNIEMGGMGGLSTYQ